MKKSPNNFDIETLIYQYVENNKDVDPIQLMDKLVSGDNNSWWMLGMTCLAAVIMQLIYNGIATGEVAASCVELPDFLNIVSLSDMYISHAKSVASIGDVIPQARDLAWYTRHPAEYAQVVAQNWTRELTVFPNFSIEYRWENVRGSVVRELLNFANTWMINNHTDLDSFMVIYFLVTPLQHITLNYDDLVIMFRVAGVVDPELVEDFSLVQFFNTFNMIIMNTDATNPNLLSAFNLRIDQIYDWNDIPRIRTIIEQLLAQNADTDRQLQEITGLTETTQEEDERFDQLGDLLITRYRAVSILQRLIELLNVRFPRT